MRIAHEVRSPQHCLDMCAAYIGHVDSILDVGCGIRPCTAWMWLRPNGRYLGIEPHAEYIAKVNETHPMHEVQQGIGIQSHIEDDSYQIVVLADVIEHCLKDVGQKLFDEAMRVAYQGVIVATPVGFMEQSDDPWGMDGEYWQRHRSGWEVDDFPDRGVVWLTQTATRGPWMTLYIPKEQA